MSFDFGSFMIGVFGTIFCQLLALFLLSLPPKVKSQKGKPYIGGPRGYR